MDHSLELPPLPPSSYYLYHSTAIVSRLCQVSLGGEEWIEGKQKKLSKEQISLCRIVCVYRSVWTKDVCSLIKTYAWNIVVCANSFGQETIPDLPCKYWGTLPLVLSDTMDHTWCGHSWFTSAYSARPYRTRLVVAGIWTRFFIKFIPYQWNYKSFMMHGKKIFPWPQVKLDEVRIILQFSCC